jgi:hypothetical protein
MHAIRSQLVVICLLAGLGATQPAAAQAREPERGLDKSAVETRFGAPQRIEGPVGDPPITKWIYADFIVVFEYDHVVHTVNRRPAVEQGPASTPPVNSPAIAPESGSAGTNFAEPPVAEPTAGGDILTLPE